MSAFDGQADLLAELFAACATWKTLTNTATVAVAKRSIRIHEAEDDGDYKLSYPRIVIYDGGTIEREKVGTSVWAGRGSLFVTFEIELAESEGKKASAQREYFVGLVSDIMREAEVIADSRATPSGYSTSHLQIRRYHRTSGPNYVLQAERGEQEGQLKTLWEMEFEIEY